MMRSTTRLAIAFSAAATCAATAHAQVHIFTTELSGANEAPPNASPGIGTSTVTFDVGAQTMRVQAEFSGLLGNVTAAHIHGATTIPFEGTAGVMTPVPTFPGFPNGVTSGTYDVTFDMTMASSYNPSFLNTHGDAAGASAFLLSSLMNGTSYLNIHSSQFGGGEIRGFYVPNPGAAVALGAGVLALSGRRRRL